MCLQAKPVTPDRNNSLSRRVSTGLWIVSLLVIGAFGVLALIPSDYYVLLPGSALPVGPMISVKGHPDGHKAGTLSMTDVSLVKVDRKLFELYYRWFRSDATFEPAQQITGGLSQSQFNTVNANYMNDSIFQAEAAALNVVPGYRITCSPPGPRIDSVLPHTPAARVLHRGDRIAALNGRHTPCVTQLRGLTKNVKPGTAIRLSIVRAGRTRTVAVRTVGSTNGQLDPRGKTTLIGVALFDHFIIPVKIAIQPGDIGGPSAGLMFALGVIQKLERQDITHGCKIAGTGTIDYTGAVGPIGGAKQKILAARAAGARYFFVPTEQDNQGPAKANAGNVKVIPVDTLKQALTFLQHLAPCH